jgi:hypothetical protein
MASPFNNREKEIVKLAVPLFKSGDIDDALTLLVILERANEDSIFANLGLTPANCDSLVSNDFALEQAVRKCFEQESLDPLREYS